MRRIRVLFGVLILLLSVGAGALPALRLWWSWREENPIRRGAGLASRAGCLSCHGPNGSQGLPDPNGGEVPAMVVIDTVVRYVPGVLGDEKSVDEESHSVPGLVEYPQYTRPRVFRGMEVPEILLSGNHEAIAEWRRQQSEARSRARHVPNQENIPERTENGGEHEESTDRSGGSGRS